MAVKKKPVKKAGDRFNAGKPKLSFVLEARHALEGVARILEKGAEKYDRANWRRGLVHSEVVDSLSPHLVAYMSGETNDPESGQPHVDHILCNALFLSELRHTHPQMDDRPIIEGKQK